MWRHIDVQGGLKKKLDLRSGSQRHRHFVGFFNMPFQAPTQNNPFYIRLFRETALFSRLLRHAGDTEDTFSTPPPSSKSKHDRPTDIHNRKSDPFVVLCFAGATKKKMFLF